MIFDADAKGRNLSLTAPILRVWRKAQERIQVQQALWGHMLKYHFLG